MKKLLWIALLTVTLVACGHTEEQKAEIVPGTTKQVEKVDIAKEPVIPMEAIKSKLLDEKWVKENVMMKVNCFDEEITHDQKLTFEKIADDLVAVQAFAYEEEADYGVQIFLVGFKDGKVQVVSYPENIPAHPGHEAFALEKEKGILQTSWEHMGETKFVNYQLSNLAITRMDEMITEDSLQLEPIHIEWNRENVEKYLSLSTSSHDGNTTVIEEGTGDNP